MNILWLSWKDRNHPQAGGAEVVGAELAKRLAHDGHSVTFITSAFAGAKPEEMLDGYRVIRTGGAPERVLVCLPLLSKKKVWHPRSGDRRVQYDTFFCAILCTRAWCAFCSSIGPRNMVL